MRQECTISSNNSKILLVSYTLSFLAAFEKIISHKVFSKKTSEIKSGCMSGYSLWHTIIATYLLVLVRNQPAALFVFYFWQERKNVFQNTAKDNWNDWSSGPYLHVYTFFVHLCFSVPSMQISYQQTLFYCIVWKDTAFWGKKYLCLMISMKHIKMNDMNKSK